MKQYQLEEQKPLKFLLNITKDQFSKFQRQFYQDQSLFDYRVIKENQFNVDEQNNEFDCKQKHRNGKQLKNKLQSEKSKFQQNELFYCGVCQIKFTSAKLTLNHKKNYHNDISDILQCQYCQKSYFGTKSLIQIRHHKKDLKRLKQENQTKIQNIEQIQASQPQENMQQ